jgi:hypothetical protein
MIPKNKEQPSKARNLIIPPDRVDGIMEKTKGILNRIDSNLYGDKVPIILPEPSNNAYVNPFQATGNNMKKEDYLDTLDKLDVLEYETEFMHQYGEHNNKNDVNISASQETIEREDFNIDMKDYDNFILKIEDLIITDDKTLGLFKNVPLYLECRVPLFKINSGTIEPGCNPNSIYYDTFK